MLLICLLFAVTCARAAEHDGSSGGGEVKVFILAGQSNMEGQGVVDLNDPRDYNGGKGTLEHVMTHSPFADKYVHLKNEAGDWVVRDDVFVRFRTRNELKKGALTIGFTGYGGEHHIGPELQFGHVIGDALDEPVLLIKTAWGGKSLHQDFRSPSAGDETGPYYTKMLTEVREALASAANDFPALAGKPLKISGFVWMQGWNDMVNEDARAEYADNLAHFIADVRRELGHERLPVVVGELGNGGEQASESMREFRAAQRAGVRQADLNGNIAFVSTTAFARPASESPNVGHGHHWFGNAESYFLIGDALGNAMVELLKNPSP